MARPRSRIPGRSDCSQRSSSMPEAVEDRCPAEHRGYVSAHPDARCLPAAGDQAVERSPGRPRAGRHEIWGSRALANATISPSLTTRVPSSNTRPATKSSENRSCSTAHRVSHERTVPTLVNTRLQNRARRFRPTGQLRKLALARGRDTRRSCRGLLSTLRSRRSRPCFRPAPVASRCRRSVTWCVTHRPRSSARTDPVRHRLTRAYS